MSLSKVVINPKFNHLSDFVAKITQSFDHEGVAIYCDRNLIKVFDVDGLKINVKRYCVPKIFFNRVVYKLFRTPKAERAYNYAFELRRRGFLTPEPIAYIITSRCGVLIDYTYFISMQDSFTHDIETYQDRDDMSSEDLRILTEFGRYTALLHENGVYHHDYGGGNILFNIVDGVPQFSLLDINRMDFGDVPMRKGYDNFRRLRICESAREAIGVAYAEGRGYDIASAALEVKGARDRHVKRRRVKRMRRFIGVKR